MASSRLSSRPTTAGDDQFNSSLSGSRTRLRPPSVQGSSSWKAADKGKSNSAFDAQPEMMESEHAKTGGHKAAEVNHGCLQSFKMGIRSLWSTRQMMQENAQVDVKITTTLRELILYVIFLLVLCLLTFGMTSSTMYYYTQVISSLFLDSNFPNSQSNFRGAGAISDFWTFAQSTLLDGLYWDTWYNNANLSTDETNYIYYENKLLGVPRIRQVKVRSDSCAVASEFRKDIKTCYAAYSKSAEDRSSFGYANSTAWNYSTADQIGTLDQSAIFTTYGGGGYYMDLKRDRDGSTEIINELFNGLWIQRGTRAVFIDFTIYNANINLFCVVKLRVEFPPTGGAMPSWEFRTVKLIRYVEPMDYFVLACEAIFMVFICYYIVEEILEIKQHRLSYFKSTWNWMDIIVITISLICGVFNVYRTMAVGHKIKELLAQEDSFPDFDFLSYWQQQFNNAIGIAVFFAWIKIFKYISFNKTMTQLSSTLGRCAKDLFGFAIMFFIVFFAFAQLGYLLFGSQVRDFREFQQCIFTLFRIILGDFDFPSLEAANRILGPLYFILYVFFVFFVLLNMFLAIINDTYSEVKDELANQPNEFEMGDYFRQRAEKVMEKLNFKRDKIIDIQKAILSADINNDNQLNFDEWRAEMKTRGYAECEIEAVFAKYDLDGDRILNEDEQQKMQSDLETQKINLPNQSEINHQIEGDEVDNSPSNDTYEERSDRILNRGGIGQPGVPLEEFTVLSRRVDRMEHSIGSIVNKIDTVLMKLEVMEKAKLKRREMMSKILDGITETEGLSNNAKADQIERLVREELDRWDSDCVSRQTPTRKTFDRLSLSTDDFSRSNSTNS